MKISFYIGVSMLLMQGVCNERSVSEERKKEVFLCPVVLLHTLTYSHPEAQFSITPDSLRKIQGLLSLEVKEIKNPGRVPINFKLSFSDSLNRWPLTGFTLYPADRGGVFNFNVSETIKTISKIRNINALNFYVALDTTDLFKIPKIAIESLEIKICSPVFK